MVHVHAYIEHIYTHGLMITKRLTILKYYNLILKYNNAKQKTSTQSDQHAASVYFKILQGHAATVKSGLNKCDRTNSTS